MQNQKLKVLSVNIFLLSYTLFIISCASRRPDIIDKTYNLKKYKSKSSFTKIIINAYDNETKEIIPANVKINDLFFQTKPENNQIKPIEIITNPNSKLNIEISSIGLHTVKVKEIHIKKGDSIIINGFLKEDNKPVY